jgi:hypothetical protein
MPLTIFDVKGVPGNRRERIEAAVVAVRSIPPGPGALHTRCAEW